MAPVFSPFAAAADPFYAMRWSYLTDVQASEDGTEQRRQLRVVPRRDVSFLARSSEAHRTGWLDALIDGAQATSLAVPLWPLGAFLVSAVTAGAGRTLAVDSTADRFVNGGYAVLWTHEGRAEEVLITGLTGTTLTADLTLDWPAGTFVIPSVRGIFRGRLDTARRSAQVADLPVTFELAHGTDPGVPTPATPAVFTTVPYVRLNVTHDYERQVDLIASPTSFSADYERSNMPVGARPFRVWVSSRAAAAALLAWFEGVKGRSTAFYLPTYQQDLAVVGGLGTSTLTITRCGYATYQLPRAARQHLAFIEPNAAITHRVVLNAVDNGVAAGTETLSLDGVAPSGATLCSYLLYGRLASDTLELRWRNNGFADCEMGFVEIPAEVVGTSGIVVPSVTRPGAGSAAVQGFAPVVVGISGGAPGLGQATVIGFPPDVAVGIGTAVAADSGALSATGFAPTIVPSAGVGQLTVTGFAPTVPIAVTKLGSLTVTGFRPRFRRGKFVAAAAAVGSVDLTGFAPTAAASAGVGLADLTGFSPTVTT